MTDPLARQGGLLFFGAFLLVGGVLLAAAAAGLLWPAWRVNQRYVAADADVLDARVDSHLDSENRRVYRPEVRIRYRADGRERETWAFDAARVGTPDRDAARARLGPFAVGGRCPCWYDPDQPDRVVVVRGYSPILIPALALPAVAVLIGLAGLARVLTRTT